VDAELVGRVGRLHERGLVDPEPFDEAADVRQRRLADADDADVLALDQVDLDQRAEQLLQRRRAHPPGGAAAEDDDAGGAGLIAGGHARSLKTISGRSNGGSTRSEGLGPGQGMGFRAENAGRWTPAAQPLRPSKLCARLRRVAQSPRALRSLREPIVRPLAEGKPWRASPPRPEAIHRTPDRWISPPSPRAPCPWFRGRKP